MKSLVKTHFLRCFILLALLFGVPLQAQSIIYDGNQGGETSIIRNYIDGVDITYTTSIDTYERFNYIDRNTLSIRTAYITIPLAVSDFVIMGDTVYFCGAYFNNNKPTVCKAVYGYFDIYNVFFGGGAISYWTIEPDVSAGVAVLGLNKLDVTKNKYGDTHLMMIGSGVYYNCSPDIIVNACIDASGNHLVKYHVDTSNRFRYDGVTFSDNFAIITAHDNVGNVNHSYNIFHYKKPTSSGITYFDTQPIVPWRFDTPSAPPPLYYSNVLLAHMTNDKFATLCHRPDASGNYQKVLSVYSDPGNLLGVQHFIIPDSSIYTQMLYNPRQETFYVVRWSNDILSIKSPYTITNTITTYDSRNGWISIDNADGDVHEILSGRDTQVQKKLWLLDESNPNGCVNYCGATNVEIPISEVSDQIIQYILRTDPTRWSFVPKVTNNNLTIICGN